MAKIATNFDFSQEIPALGPGKNHNSINIKNNALRPEIFNEYERVMGELCDATGDLSFAELDGNPTNLSLAINTLLAQNKEYITTNKLTVLGSADLGAIRLGWKPTNNYAVNDLIIADSSMYRCIEQHRSSAVFSMDLAKWALVGGGGGTTTDIILSGHGFEVGEVLFYYSSEATPGGYKRAKANNMGSLGLFLVADDIDDNTFKIIQAGHYTIPIGKNLSQALDTSGEVFEPNTWYYLSETEAGKLTKTEPMFSNPILYAVGEREAYITGYRPSNITKSTIFEFTYISGQTDYELDFIPDPFVGSILSMGGVVQHSTDYSFDGKILRLNETYEPGVEGRLMYLHSFSTNVTTSLEPYVFLTSGETSTFSLRYAPAAKEYTLMFVNGMGYWDYNIVGSDIITAEPIPTDHEVRILDIRSACVVTSDMAGVSDNTIPGTKIIQKSIDISKLSDDIQAALPLSYGFSAQISGDIDTLSGEVDDLQSIVYAQGWIPSNESWTYSSADSPTFTFTISGDKTSKYSKGMKVKYDQEQALTGYWMFESDASSQVGSFTPTNIGTPTYTAGKFGNALTLEGLGSAIALADNALLKPTGSFTIGMWFRTPSSGTYKVLFQSGSANTNYAGVFIRINNNDKLLFYIGNNTSSSVFTSIVGSATVTDNNWHYLVCTFRNNWGQMYLDGILEGSGYMYAPVYAATNYVRVGIGNNSGTNIFQYGGQIDDLFLINGYALDEETIKAKYDAQTAQGTGDITVTKKGIITDLSYSAPNTTITMYGGTDFALSNGAISNPYYSMVEQPYGWNNEYEKWGKGDKIGEIAMYASKYPPINYLKCDGSSLSITTYDKLFRRIGYSYGGSGANFNIPNYQAVSPKGTGNQTINTRVKSGPAFAVVEEDRIQGHNITNIVPVIMYSGAAGYTMSGGSGWTASAIIGGSLTNDGTNGDPRVGATTRDNTLGTNFCIRFR